MFKIFKPAHPVFFFLTFLVLFVGPPVLQDASGTPTALDLAENQKILITQVFGFFKVQKFKKGSRMRLI